MLDRMDELVCGAIVVAFCFCGMGFAMQDWGGDPGKHTTLTDVHDATWGTWVTGYVLAAMGVIFGIAAPGEGLVRSVARLAFELEAISWAAHSVMHQFFAKGGDVHDMLWFTGATAFTAALFGKACAAHMFIQETGICRCFGSLDPREMDPKDESDVELQVHQMATARIFGGVGLVAAVTVPVLILFQPNVGGWIHLVAVQGFTLCLMIGFGAAGGAFCGSAGMFIGFAGTLFFKHVYMPPFKFSHDFNDHGLAHTCWMVYMASSYALLLQLYAEIRLAHEELEEQLRAKREQEALLAREAEEEAQRRVAETGCLISMCCSAAAARGGDPHSFTACVEVRRPLPRMWTVDFPLLARRG
eukprot:CAMPEP_0170239508 /NCGR_PEP_ID=MMETSP0116_2-20130129/19510_1 /TAXON_ID=400756 /ORGANISM="Durinskia baltica, Strain CSIRO CS-38" /LENGTH=357 /DNA_ID=CAMNT_0010490323 /DNA_START=129 /DNA_END=1199 /DNA_ORIENTATION=+